MLKKFFLVFVFLVVPQLIFSLEGKDMVQQKENGKKILIVYYSRTGNTMRVAEDLAVELKADIQRIIDKKNRSGFWGALSAGKDAMFNKDTKIEDIEKNISDYDIIIIGTPIWAGNMAPAIKTFILKYNNSIKDIAFFVTADSTSADKVVLKMEKLCNKKALSSIGFLKKELKPESVDKYKEKILSFSNLLK